MIKLLALIAAGVFTASVALLPQAGSVSASSSCPGFIPATITTPADLITAINQAQSASCVGADTIDLAGNTITFTSSAFGDSAAEPLATPTITTPLTIFNGTVERQSPNPFGLFAVGFGGNLTLGNMTLRGGGGGTEADGIATGGAVDVNNGTLTVSRTRFVGNSAPAYGGGAIMVGPGSTLAVADSVFEHNSAQHGGAIAAQGNLHDITRTRFVGNMVAGFNSGGSALQADFGTFEITDSLLVGGIGSAIASSIGETLTVVNTTIAGNLGPAVVTPGNATSTHTYRNTAIWGNGSGILNFGTTVITAEQSAIQGFAGSVVPGTVPLDAMFSDPLADIVNGTGTNYDDADYDWTPAAGSPLLDRGNNAHASATDVAGQVRRVDNPAVTDLGLGTAPVVDIGAYERQVTMALDFSSAAPTISEADGFAGATVTITTAHGGVTPEEVQAQITVVGGTASAADYSFASTGELTIPAGVASGSSIPIDGVLAVVDDEIAEGAETLTLRISAPNADPGLDGTATFTITDDDTAGFVVDSSATAATISEPAGTTTFTVALRSQPTSDVDVLPVSSDSTTCVASPNLLTFTPANWNIPRSVSITAVDNGATDAGRPCSISLAVLPQSAAEYQSVTSPPVTLTVTDPSSATTTTTTTTTSSTTVAPDSTTTTSSTSTTSTVVPGASTTAVPPTTATPTGDLPVTGSGAVPQVTIAVALLALGGVLLLARRRPATR